MKLSKNIIARDTVGDYIVSTVKLHEMYPAYGLGAFETLIKGVGGDWGWRDFVRRTDTKVEALAAHAEAVAFVRENVN